MPSRDKNPWEEVQDRLQTVLDDHSYKNWFAQTHFESFHDGYLTVQVPSPFFAAWLRDHYLDVIAGSVREMFPEFRELRFSLASGATAPAAIPVVPDMNGAAAASRKKAAKLMPRFTGFNSRYTFDRFVIGSGNRFAHAAAKAVAENPGRAYNPLFLRGYTGLGKTHLMQAIGQEVLGRDTGASVVFLSSEQFTNELIDCIARKSMPRFRAKYRKVDVLLIDDIHFIAGKEATQEEFFHTFNELFDMHKQIVLSSDRGPKDIQGLEERLVSRFEMGLVTDIQPPDTETRMAILQNKASEENFTVPPDIVRYIATYVTSNIRELEGALTAVLAYARLQNEPFSIEMVQDVLHDLVGRHKLRPITIEGIQKVVAEHFDVRIADLRGRSRQRQIAYPRQMAMYFCRQLVPTLSLGVIGEAFGGKDHTTVIHACKKISAESQGDESARQRLVQIEKAIRA